MRFTWIFYIGLFYLFFPLHKSCKGQNIFDTDPGYGNAVSIPVSNLENGSLEFTATVENLEPGFHTLYIRTLGDSGRWSNTINRKVLVEEFNFRDTVPIQKAEYFFDNDPGYGLGVSNSQCY